MEMTIILLNFAYAAAGGIITILFMMLGYKIFDKMTPYKTHEALESGNVAVGIVVGSVFVGIGIAIGLVIGLGLN